MFSFSATSDQLIPLSPRIEVFPQPQIIQYNIIFPNYFSYFKIMSHKVTKAYPPGKFSMPPNRK